jgi:hypothetical protein
MIMIIMMTTTMTIMTLMKMMMSLEDLRPTNGKQTLASLFVWGKKSSNHTLNAENYVFPVISLTHIYCISVP